MIKLSAGAGPLGLKLAAVTLLAFFSHWIVISVAMLTKALEVIGAMNWDVLKALAFAILGLTFDLLIFGIDVVMVLESVVAEAFSCRS